ncbi:MAG TPA: DUF983 domain-containing protein [Saprospiraceae bacterium]|jgi:uncharacterized protein (DUF983 family)|nr:DUF983 domain-containing protein [Saprospiraceae bacterium]MBK6667478.1 DUF983 domain-containing protein [Saprospiraceae bacterium]MBK7697893.1 DUF983 domain-containing protein [Saprospiraceae bacterium]MBK8825140.1 DUF983 domain-containing protein [Saprospiraceae bacterium]MBK8885590.1 DUF983 domain-containing protein [Saprospiraceae bacterium]
MSKRNFIINAFMQKCPRCQEGDLFIKPFEISKPVNMPVNCPVCNQKYEPEPGFYYGSMFLSYIFSAFFFLGIMGLCLIVFKMSLNASMGVLLLTAALTYLFFLRMSRSIWINLMVKYDPKAKESKEVKSFGY